MNFACIDQNVSYTSCGIWPFPWPIFESIIFGHQASLDDFWTVLDGSVFYEILVTFVQNLSAEILDFHNT